jgi:hypothetical protein
MSLFIPDHSSKKYSVKPSPSRVTVQGWQAEAMPEASRLVTAYLNRVSHFSTILVYKFKIPEMKVACILFFDHGSQAVYCECGNLLELF